MGKINEYDKIMIENQSENMEIKEILLEFTACKCELMPESAE